jgi:hypothetical protein
MKNIDRLPFKMWLQEWLETPREDMSVAPRYVIGCDSGVTTSTFCLAKTDSNGSFEILLLKQFINEDQPITVKTEFETQVENISKYFNATIIK